VAANDRDPIATIERFIEAVRLVRDGFAPLGVPARRIAQLDIVIMESEAELRRLRAAEEPG
jgi:hypothetical protein